MDRNNTNAALKNLAYLCLDDHDEYDTAPSQSKGFIPGELILYRERLYAAIERGDHLVKEKAPKTNAVPNDVIEHDRKLFAAADKLLPENLLKDILDCLGSDHSFQSFQMTALSRFREWMGQESNSFIVDDLCDVTKKLITALDELQGYAVHTFFVFPEKQRAEEGMLRYCMYPDLNVDRGGSGTTAQMNAYDTHATRLIELVNAGEDAYREYRRSVKRTLQI